MHNDHLFDKHNPDDLKTLSIWEEKSTEDNQYIATIEIWTKKDVEKVQTAIKNKLNYEILWNIDDIENFCNTFTDKMSI